MADRHVNPFRPTRPPDRPTRAGADVAAAVVTVATIAGANLLLVFGLDRSVFSLLAIFVVNPIANAALAVALRVSPGWIERATGTTVNLPGWLIAWGCGTAVCLDAFAPFAGYGC